jgi:hypothetical protein
MWTKIGSISAVDISDDIFKVRVIEARGHSHTAADPKDGEPFWFKRTHSNAIMTMADDLPEAYLKSLNLPFIDFKGVNLLVMGKTLDWHSDSGRITTLNIGIRNSHLGRVEFEDGSSYIMNDGDIYCLDVTNKHRIVLDDEHGELGPKSRIILNIGIKTGFNSIEVQTMIKDIKEHLHSKINKH